MKRIYFLFLVLVSIVILSCSGSKYTPVPFQTGNYSFTMSDSLGNRLIDGDMKLDTNALGKITGTYNITKKYVTDFPGLSTMTGNCEGTYVKTEGMIHLNMNPKIADANVFIGAKIYRTSLAGEWNFSTFRIGNNSKGSFVATYLD